MLKKRAVLMLALGLFCVDGQAYLENYPPFPFGKNDLNPCAVEPIIIEAPDSEKAIKLGKIEVKRGFTKGSVRMDYPVALSFVEIRHEGRLVASLNESSEELFWIGDIFYVDLDQNDLKDFVIPINEKGTGLAGMEDTVIIFFQVEAGQFRKVSYVTYHFEIADIVDVNGDGRFEFIITEFAQLDSADSQIHSYWFYNLYKIEGFNLVIANELHPRFPKAIWFTDQSNDKETKKLSPKQKQAFIKSLPQEIISKDPLLPLL